MVPETDSHHLFPVGGAEIETVGGFFVAEVFCWSFMIWITVLVIALSIFLEGILLLPRILGRLASQIGDVQRGRVLGIGAA